MTKNDKKNILIVEDQGIVALDLKSKIEIMGYEVVGIVSSGEDAIVKAEAHLPDLVMMDIHLAGKMDGITAANEIYESHFIPIVFLTAHADKKTIERVKSSHPFGYITKPFLDADLKTSIELALFNHSHEKDSLNRVSLILNSIGDAVLTISLEGLVTYMNPTAERILGIDQALFLGKPFSSLLSTTSPNNGKQEGEIISQIKRAISSKGSDFFGEEKIYNIQGDPIFIDYTLSAINDAENESLNGAVLTFRDITQRKSAERDLLKSEASLKIAQRIAKLGSWDWDITHNTLYWSDEIYRIFGLQPQQFGATYEAFLDFVHPEDRQDVIDAVDQALGGNINYRLDHRIVLPSGEIRIVHEQGEVTFDETGAASRMIGTVHDITERINQIKEREMIQTVATELRNAETQEEMLPIISSQLQSILNSKGVFLLMKDNVTGEIIFDHGIGIWENIDYANLAQDTGVCGLVISTGEQYISNDAQNDEIVSQPQMLGNIKSIICSPLVVQNQTLGAILVGRQAEFSDKDSSLLAAIADMSANAIQRSAFHEQTRERLRRISAQRNIAMAITSSMDINVILQIFLTETISQLGPDAANVLFFNQDLGEFKYKIGQGFIYENFPKVLPLSGNHLAAETANTRQLVFVPDLSYRKDDLIRPEMVTEEKFTTYFGLPLISKQRILGVLEIWFRDEFTPNNNWFDFLDSLGNQAALAIDNTTLFESVLRSNLDMSLAYDSTLEGWAKALELRDEETEGHSQRVVDLTLRLAHTLGIDEEELVHIRRGAVLHDIGKMGIPDAILNKPGPLDDEEWELMRQHPGYAYNLLSKINFLNAALDIPYSHHERWDGKGYPQKLKGTAIPYAARVFTLVDVWDALTSDRPYRKAWSKEKTISYIQEQSGIMFDPEIVPAFLSLVSEG